MIKLKESKISDILKIKEVKLSELEQAFKVLNQLRPNLCFEEYIEIVKNMDRYQVVCLFENEEVVSYAGFSKQANLYYGNHIWVYDLVTDEAKRGQGLGRILLSYLEECARENSLNCVALSSGLARVDAHKFYEKAMNYDKVSYVFKKNLK
ncbi:MAG: GNAT family N-acetyltransferase [Defluviitaleaceae bacterium]|nr:GNAT family N-acetyltransferase [Defluviitaleaceae bacterium]